MINFSLAGIPVAVRPSFWLVAALLGMGIGDNRLLAVWIGIVFVSVLLHEMGHAVTARRFGAEVAVELTTFGGLTSWRAQGGGLSPGRRALVAGAGSAVGILVGLAVLGIYRLIAPGSATAGLVVIMIVWVNVGWGVLNWLPIRPLDGGHLLMSLMDMVAPQRADRIGDAVFLVTSLVALGVAVYFRLIFVIFLAGFLVWSEISRHVGKRRRHAGPPVEPDERAALPPSDDTTGVDTDR